MLYLWDLWAGYTSYRAEAIKMGFYEYNEQFHIQNERQYAYAELHEKGRAEGRVKGSWLERLCRICKKRKRNHGWTGS